MNEESIFAAAIEKKTAAERQDYLDDACAGQSELRSEVEKLLEASAAAGSFLEHPPVGAEPTVVSSHDNTASPTNWAGTLPFLKPCDKPDRIGQLDQYEIIEVVGYGGMGAVLRAFDTKLSRVVAVKVMSPNLATNATAMKRFLREATTAASIHHEHVVTIHAVNDSHVPPYLVMQFIEGQTLEQKIDREGPLQLETLLRIASQAAAGLAAAHRLGIIHRDIKPANILLENGVERVKISDFGLARAADDVQMTQTGIIAGTPQYMSPEQARGEPIDARSDLFSLGSVFYTMCTGRSAFRADNPVAVLRRVCDDTPRPIYDINPQIPAWLEAIVSKLLAKHPANRFQSADELAELLQRYLAHVQNPALAPPPAASEIIVAELATPARLPPTPTPVSWPPHRWLARQFAERPVQASSVTFIILLTIVTLFTQAMIIYLAATRRPSRLLPVAPSAVVRPTVPNRDWVLLFNGKDLTGWKTLPQQPGDWKVENAVLVGRGPLSHLFSEKTYGNFHLRAECKLLQGDSGIRFRNELGFSANANQAIPIGYEAQIIGPQGDEEQGRTGSIRRSMLPLAMVTKNMITLGQWFTLEIVAEGNHLVTRVNGELAADCHDPDAYLAGHLALQVGGGNRPTVVEFRKIEIRELTALDVARTATAPAQARRESAAWQPPENPVPSAILLEAQADAKTGKYDVALAKFVWFFEHALEYDPNQSSVRSSAALRYWAELARDYPPAFEALIALRNEAAANVKSGKNIRNSFHDLVYIDRTIDEDDFTVEIFKLLDSQFPAEAKLAYRLAEPSLVKTKEFKLCGKYVKPDYFDQSVNLLHMNKRLASKQKDGGKHLLEFAENSFTNSTATLIALLVVNGRRAEAQGIAEEAAKEWNNSKFRAAIDDALKGKVPEPWPPSNPVIRRADKK